MTRFLKISLCLVAASAQADVKVFEGTSKLISTTIDALPSLERPQPEQIKVVDGKPVAVAIGENKEVGAELVILGTPADALWSGFSRGNPEVKIESRNGVTFGGEKLVAVFQEIKLPGIVCTRPESEALAKFIVAVANDPILKDFGQTRCVVSVGVKGVISGATVVRDN